MTAEVAISESLRNPHPFHPLSFGKECGRGEMFFVVGGPRASARRLACALGYYLFVPTGLQNALRGGWNMLVRGSESVVELKRG